jgi:hypothetical protein
MKVQIDEVQTGDDPSETRYGCYLPVLTGLASNSSAASLHLRYSTVGATHGKARNRESIC